MKQWLRIIGFAMLVLGVSLLMKSCETRPEKTSQPAPFEAACTVVVGVEERCESWRHDMRVENKTSLALTLEERPEKEDRINRGGEVEIVTIAPYGTATLLHAHSAYLVETAAGEYLGYLNPRPR